MEKENYKRFLLMLSLSFLVMYAVMFLNAAQFEHVYINLNRFYMAVLMVAPMAFIMLFFMRGMYENKRLNLLIIGISTVAFFSALFMLRNQVFVGDAAFMRSMIPHHSSAILVSSQANLTDPEVKELAREIIESQEKEIAQMKEILRRMD